MILKELLPRAMAASLAALAVSSPADLRADSDEAYNVNDVLLFLQNPAGTVGTDKVVYYSLGSAVTVFRDAAAGSVTNLGNINTTLNATFGNDWTNQASTIYTGAAGQNGATSNLATTNTNGDYARTVYVTKARAGVGSLGQANSASPLFDPAQTAVAGNIAGSNNMAGMTQPGVVAVGDTLIDGYNPFSNGNPSTAYGAIAGGIQNNISNSTVTFGSVSNVVTALDLYRVTKTTGTNASSNSTWQVANNKTATYSKSDYPGSNGARADYLGTITISSDGSVNFIAQGTAPVVDDAYTVNDILLFLQNPAGTVGTDKVVYYSLGSAVNVFRDVATGLVTNLGNINTILNATFGNDWTNQAATIYVGAAGQNGATSNLATSITSGDYARTVYVTKARAAVGTPGQANSASPLFDPAQTAVAGNIAGSNNIAGMTQPGVVAVGDTLIDGYNPFSNGNPSTAYGAIAGGIQNNISNSTLTFGSVSNVVTALDLYRVTKTTGTNASSNSTWQVANNKTATYSKNDYPGSNGARADFLGTITLSSDGSVNFSAAASGSETPAIPSITSVTSGNGEVGQSFSYQITASNNATSFGATGLPAGLSVNTTTGVISGTPTNAGIFQTSIFATNSGGSGNASLSLTIAKGTPFINILPVASAIIAGETLSSSNLSGGNASVAGTFAFANPSFAPSATGSQIVVFTPYDAANFTTANTSVSVTVNPAPVTPFNNWTGGNVSMTPQLLSLYAIGAGSYDGATAPETTVLSTTGGNLSLTAIVRSNDPSLTVSAETTTTLGGSWTAVGNGTTSGVDQTGVPPDHQRRLFSTPIGSDTKKFLRLRISHSQN